MDIVHGPVLEILLLTIIFSGLLVEIKTGGLGAGALLGLVAAALGVAAMLYSIVLTLGGDIGALYALLAAMALSILLFVLLLRHLPSSRLWNKVILRDASTAARGYVSAAEHSELVGRQGRAETDLRPAGTVSFGDVPMDVVSEGGYIPRGTIVVVVAVQGSRVVVRPAGPEKQG